MLEKLESYLYVPEVRALLDAIAYCERTDRLDEFGPGGKDGLCGYGTGFGYRTFNPFDATGHPLVVDKVSTASGRYQFLNRIWREDITDHVPELRGTFTPRAQDLAAIRQLLIKRRVIHDLIDGEFKDVLRMISYEWASIPYSAFLFRYRKQEGPFNSKQFMEFYKNRLTFWKGAEAAGQLQNCVEMLHKGEPPGYATAGEIHQWV